MTNEQEFDAAVMEYMLECPECPKNGFKELWGNTGKWLEHVMSEHKYTPEDVQRMFEGWESDIAEIINNQMYDYAHDEWEMVDRQYEEWKEGNI